MRDAEAGAEVRVRKQEGHPVLSWQEGRGRERTPARAVRPGLDEYNQSASCRGRGPEARGRSRGDTPCRRLEAG